MRGGRRARAVRARSRTRRVGWYASASRPPPDGPLSLGRLAEESIVTFPSTTTPYRCLERLFADRDRPPLLHGSASLSIVRHLVAQGFGIGILPRAMVAPEGGGQDVPSGRADVRRLAVCGEAVPAPLRFVVAWRDVPGAVAGPAVGRAAAGCGNPLRERSPERFSRSGMGTTRGYSETRVSVLSNGRRFRLAARNARRCVRAAASREAKRRDEPSWRTACVATGGMQSLVYWIDKSRDRQDMAGSYYLSVQSALYSGIPILGRHAPAEPQNGWRGQLW